MVNSCRELTPIGIYIHNVCMYVRLCVCREREYTVVASLRHQLSKLVVGESCWMHFEPLE